MEKLYKLRNYQGKNFLERVRYFKIFVLFQKIFKIYLELLFYSELGKLSDEYLQFNTITNIEYMRKFERDSIFITMVLEMNNDFDFEKIYGKKHQIHYNDWYVKKEKCLSSLKSEFFKIYNDDDDENFDKDELTLIKLICNNISLVEIMERNFFYDYFLSNVFDIQFSQFINSSRYSIGYLISNEIKNDQVYPMKPVLTLQMKNILYDHDHILVCIKK